MKYTLETRLPGLKAEYHILKVFDYKNDIMAVHTSKKLNYLLKLLKERYSK